MEKEQIFTVGDSTTHGEIQSFEIIDNDMYAKCSRGIFNLKEIELAKQPLFTTFDNVDIHEGGRAFRVLSNSFHIIDYLELTEDNYTHQDKWFSTAKAAKEYVLLNKPCLSIQNVMDRLHGYFQHDLVIAAFNNLKEYISSLNK